MLKTIIDRFKPVFYRESHFYIVKNDQEVYSVAANNGLSANVCFSNNNMFVDVFDKPSNILTRYCTPLDNSTVSKDDIVIENIKSSILFKLRKHEIDPFIRKNYSVFRDMELDIDYPDHIRNDGYIQDLPVHRSCLSTVFNKVCYPHIFFSTKKVVENIYKYTFKTIHKNSHKAYFSYYYFIGAAVFSLCNLHTFISNISAYAPDDDVATYGIEDQLQQSVDVYKHHLNTKAIFMLKSLSGDYCYIKKSQRQLTIVYLADFNWHLEDFKEYADYVKFWHSIFGMPKTSPFYRKARLITHTWHKGKTKTKRSSFTLDIAKRHEFAIHHEVMKNFVYNKVTYPSESVLTALSGLGISCELPLSLDDLTVLDMYQV